MKIKRITGGPLPTNCYLLTDEATGRTAVVDPGFIDNELLAAIQNVGIDKVTHILLTHGHFDHLGGALELKELTGAKIYLYGADDSFTQDPDLNLASMLTEEPYRPFEADVLLNDNEEFLLGNTEIKVLHTPGHTHGSCCFLAGDALFTGDTLFFCSLGRTDFPTGSDSKIMLSLRRLAELPGDYHVYPGHEAETTLENERRYNPYMRQA